MKEINLNGSSITLYALCVIAAALEEHGEVTIQGADMPKRPKTSTEWLAEFERGQNRRTNGDLP